MAKMPEPPDKQLKSMPEVVCGMIIALTNNPSTKTSETPEEVGEISHHLYIVEKSRLNREDRDMFRGTFPVILAKFPKQFNYNLTRQIHDLITRFNREDAEEDQADTGRSTVF